MMRTIDEDSWVEICNELSTPLPRDRTQFALPFFQQNIKRIENLGPIAETVT